MNFGLQIFERTARAFGRSLEKEFLHVITSKPVFRPLVIAGLIEAKVRSGINTIGQGMYRYAFMANDTISRIGSAAVTQIPSFLGWTMKSLEKGLLRVITNKPIFQATLVAGLIEAKIRNGLHALGQSFKALGHSIKALGQSIKALAPKFKESFSKLGAKAGSMIDVKKLFQATVGSAMKQQNQKDMFIARTGNDQVGTAMFEKFKKEALAAGEDANEYLSNSLSFMSVAQNSDQISKLNNIAQRLAIFDPEKKGLKANGEAIKNVLSGDTASMDSIAKRFGMDKNQVKDLKLDKLLQKGDVGGAITALDKLLEKNNMGQAAYDKISKSPANQVGTMMNNFKNALTETGQAALTALLPVITIINEAFQSGKFQPFFDGLKAGLNVIAQGVAAFAGFIMNHLGLVQNVLIALGIVLLVLAGIWLIQWFSAFWPVFLVIGVLVLLLEILNQFGISTSQVVGFVAGLFFSLFAMIYNRIALFWNIILAVAEFFANVWNEPGYAFKKLFYDLFKSVSEYFINLINGAIKGLDWLIEKVNEITGSKFSLIGKFESEWVDKLKPDPKTGTVDYSNLRWEQKDLSQAFSEGQDFAANAMNFGGGKVEDMSNLWNNKGTNIPPAKQPGSQLPNINRVNEIGEINNTVDISSEDLEVMRDLAEIQSIQNFVTLTPTVQVTTGDIHQPADANEMIRRIEEVMSREIANSAQGVYA